MNNINKFQKGDIVFAHPLYPMRVGGVYCNSDDYSSCYYFCHNVDEFIMNGVSFKETLLYSYNIQGKWKYYCDNLDKL